MRYSVANHIIIIFQLLRLYNFQVTQGFFHLSSLVFKITEGKEI